jgi:hypothetical protein
MGFLIGFGLMILGYIPAVALGTYFIVKYVGMLKLFKSNKDAQIRNRSETNVARLSMRETDIDEKIPDELKNTKPSNREQKRADDENLEKGERKPAVSSSSVKTKENDDNKKGDAKNDNEIAGSETYDIEGGVGAGQEGAGEEASHSST